MVTGVGDRDSLIRNLPLATGCLVQHKSVRVRVSLISLLGKCSRGKSQHRTDQQTANDVNAARAADIHAIAVAFEVDATRANSLSADAVVTAYENLPSSIKAITGLQVA